MNLELTERTLGTVLLGQTGMGKTSLMEHLIAEDIGKTTGFIFDPHGELSERILRIGADIAPDTLLFCEIGAESYGFNPLEVQTPGDPLEESQTIDSLMQVFRKHWGIIRPLASARGRSGCCRIPSAQSSLTLVIP